MKDSAKAIWMRRRDGIESYEDDRLDLLPDEPTRALWNACPNPPPLDAAEVQAAFRRALQESGVKPRWWFMPRPISLTSATCGGVLVAAFLAFGPSNGPSAWLPLIKSITPGQSMANEVVRPLRQPLAKSPPAAPVTVAKAVTAKPVIAKTSEALSMTPVAGTAKTITAPALKENSKRLVGAPKTQPALPRVALAAPAVSSRAYLYVAVTKTEPSITASITHDESNRGGYAKVTALRPNDNGVLVRTEATVTSTEPDPQVVTHVPSWATGTNGLPAPMSTRSNVAVPAADRGKE